MATTLSDAMYAGLAHAAPPLHHRREQVIAARWTEWTPWATMESRRHSDPASIMFVLKTTHRSRLMSLLDARIPWPTIRRNRLDDPTMTGEAFEFQLRAAKMRRAVRMGRVKGKGKKYASKP